MKTLKLALLAGTAFGAGVALGALWMFLYAVFTLARGTEIDFLAFTGEPDDWWDQFDDAADWEAAKAAWEEELGS